MTPTIPDFVFEAGNLALDLVNTRPMSNGRPVDLVIDDDSVDAWVAAAGLAERGALLGSAPPVRRAVVAEMRALRDAAAGIAASLRHGTSVADADVEVVDRLVATRTWTRRLRRNRDGFDLREVAADDGPTAVLAPVAEAAAALLTEVDPARVRDCDDEACVLWFVDTTRNGSRRWCSMERCGNRAKSAAHYRRSRRAQKQRGT
jgi:predicted RNA-binding Zn ribbon-like protein